MRPRVGCFLGLALTLLLSSPVGADGLGMLTRDIEARYHAQRAAAQTSAAPFAPVSRAADAVPDTAMIELIDLRIALVQLARIAGTNEQLTVLRAQPEDGRVLSIRSGSLSLPGLLEQAETLSPGAVGPNGLTLPVIIQADANLRLGAGEVLTLSRGDGAFLVNFGGLEVLGGGVEARGPANAVAPTFRPFVMTSGTGHLVADGAVFEGLGFGRTLNFAGVSLISGGLYPPDQPSSVSRSLFRDIGALAIKGGKDLEIADNVFFANAKSAIQLRAVRRVRLHRNTILDTQDGDAIRISHQSGAVDLRGNDLLGIAGNGVRVAGNSHGVRVIDTLVWRAGRSAVSVDRSDCIEITKLSALHSAQKGVVLRQSRGSHLVDSKVMGSGGSGVFVADQPTGTVTPISGTVFHTNRAGLSTAAPGTLSLSRNDLTGQFPRFLDGDIQGASHDILTDLTGEADLTLTLGGVVADFLPPLTCPSFEES